MLLIEEPIPYLLFASGFFTSQQNYKAEYEDIKTRCFFPQTITPEYEVDKKLALCKDVSDSLVPVIGIPKSQRVNNIENIKKEN